MTAYTAINVIDTFATTTENAWDTWYQFSCQASDITESAIRWYCKTFFSSKAKQRYEEIGQIIGFGLVVIAAVGITASILVQDWAESEVQSCIAIEAPTAAIEAMPETAPVATLVVKVDAPKTLTSAELRRQCQAAGIRWRNAHGKGRHLSKGEMIAALA